MDKFNYLNVYFVTLFTLAAFGHVKVDSQSYPPQCNTDIKVLFIGFRHGARVVAQFLPNDTNNDKWTVALGQLTPQGMLQHYKNGGLVLARYPTLFPRYDATRLLARSSGVDRTLMSAASFLAGLFPPKGNQIFLQGLNWQPAAIYTSAVLEADANPDLLRRVSEDAVPYLFKADEDTVKILEQASGIKAKKNSLGFFSLLDNLVTENFAGFPLPYGLDKNLMPKIQRLKDLMFIIMFGSRELRCHIAPPILHDLIEKAELVLRNETKQTVYIWSMHDANVFALLSILNEYVEESPPFTATVFFEVHALANCQDYEIKFFYRKNVEDSANDYKRLEITNCSQPCTLIQMKTIVETIEKDCKFDSEKMYPNCFGHMSHV